MFEKFMENNFEKNLDYLFNKRTEYINKNQAEEDLMTPFDKKIYVYLHKKITSKQYNKYYINVVIKRLNDIFNNLTVSDLLFLIELDELLNNTQFIDKLYDNIISLKNSKDIYYYINQKLYRKFEKYPYLKEKFNSTKFIDDLINRNLNPYDYNMYFRFFDENNQKYFIDKCIENKININYWGNFGGVFQFLSDNNINYVNSRIIDILPYTDDIFLIKDYYKDSDKKEIIEKFIETHPECVYKNIESKIKDVYHKNDQGIPNQDILDIANMIIKEIVAEDNTKMNDINYVIGGYSLVIFTNSKVIKIGGERQTELFPDNPYIVTPLIRKNLSNDDCKCFIEVTEKVQGNIKVTDEELYELYKKLRDLGLVWTDVDEKNVGRLEKANTIYWNKNIAHETNYLTFDGKVGEGMLQAGDLIILDADWIYKENDPNIEVPRSSKYPEFEERYQEELNNNKKL